MFSWSYLWFFSSFRIWAETVLVHFVPCFGYELENTKKNKDVQFTFKMCNSRCRYKKPWEYLWLFDVRCLYVKIFETVYTFNSVWKNCRLKRMLRFSICCTKDDFSISFFLLVAHFENKRENVLNLPINKQYLKV